MNIFAYNLETILAEKLETVISRGDQNTRPRDYYDIFILYSLKGDKVNPFWLRQAIEKTSQKRHSSEIIPEYRSIMLQVQSSEVMLSHWKKYQRDYEYAQGLNFTELCESVIKIMDSLA